ncbi:MAG: threonine--tRNA ligase [Gammaproteobacteria bacterium]|nr:threonine--tRNA ligase [Gammaproteobacteria bacterium]
MPKITLPDGKILEFSDALSVYDVAASIGSGLARAALAGKIGEQLVDLSYLIEEDVALQIITDKDPLVLELIRHSTAHLLACAAKQIFPDLQVTIGPSIEDGFYYDFAFSRSFTPEDVEKISKRMLEIAKKDLPITHREVSRAEAIKLFTEMGEKYKVEIIKDIPEDEVIKLYQLDDFVDPCRGPHVPSTGKLKAFKLTKLAGAYWRGDSKNEMLQRVYGTAWVDKKQLEAYLQRIEEAKKRDHRVLGKQMDLFHFQDEAPGMAFWHNNGWIIYQQVIQYMREALRHHDYQEVNTPIFMDVSLWEKSGHWEKYAENMFATELENRVYAVKPMNCPGNIQIFNQGIKSYRDLPTKMGEFGLCHRYEPSGTLMGLMRIRQFTQDDAHVYCTDEQLQDEIGKLIDLVHTTYRAFGFEDVMIRLATRPEKRIGSDEDWDRAEEALEKALVDRDIDFEWAPGEGAFYGPKHEFHLRDCLGRVWQCGTIQVDFSMPRRLGAEYVAEDGSRKIPIMIHRAILGSIERFIAILLEHYAGVLPLWVAPVQAVVMNITDTQADYAQKVTESLNNLGLRVKYDLRNEKIGFKIREHTIKRVSYLLVVGDREVEQGKVAVRTQAGKDLGGMSVDDLAAFLLEESKQPSY